MDVDFWVRVLLRGDAVLLNAALAAFRVSPSSWSSNLGLRQAREYRRWLRVLAADPRFGLSSRDIVAGSAWAEINAVGRQAVYTLLAMSRPRA